MSVAFLIIGGFHLAAIVCGLIAVMIDRETPRSRAIRPLQPLCDADTLQRRVNDLKALETPLCEHCPLNEKQQEESMARKAKIQNPDTIVVFKQSKVTKKWNYTVKNINGHKIFWSTQGYNNYVDAERALYNACADVAGFTAVYEGLPKAK